MGNKHFCTAGTCTCPGRALRLGGCQWWGLSVPRRAVLLQKEGLSSPSFMLVLGGWFR